MVQHSLQVRCLVMCYHYCLFTGNCFFFSSLSFHISSTYDATTVWPHKMPYFVRLTSSSLV